ncbi:hypothetical protein VNO77_39670 [Canavalia gladiata]|uniref:Uncharacterized protein n=1 Tax=Canavalia gladiata TaxID=3824 RepID=A0AAN9JZW3_CANGL
MGTKKELDGKQLRNGKRGWCELRSLEELMDGKFNVNLRSLIVMWKVCDAILQASFNVLLGFDFHSCYQFKVGVEKPVLNCIIYSTKSGHSSISMKSRIHIRTS